MTADMSTWPTVQRWSGLIERKCPHGIGHPDPDSVAEMEAKGWKGYDVHSCDGCCYSCYTGGSVRYE